MEPDVKEDVDNVAYLQSQVIWAIGYPPLVWAAELYLDSKMA